jgi:hypothetical protein
MHSMDGLTERLLSRWTESYAESVKFGCLRCPSMRVDERHYGRQVPNPPSTAVSAQVRWHAKQATFRICRLFSERASDLSKSYRGKVGCIRISRPERLHIAKRFAVKCEGCQ